MTGVADFAGVEQVVGDDLRFRLRLGIGENAYRSIRYSKQLQSLWDVGGVAATGAGLAQSSVVAGTFFGGSGFMAALGLGTAVTPIGWVLAAGVASAGAYWGVMRLCGNYGASRVAQVPEFINSPIDWLGATLVDMIGTLSVKLAMIDGEFHDDERRAIITYFVEGWGIDATYAEKAVAVLSENAHRMSLREAAHVLGQFMRDNPDCNAEVMRRDLLSLLREIAEADGHRDEREEMALEMVDRALSEEIAFSVSRTVQGVGRSLSETGTAAVGGISRAAGAIGRSVGSAVQQGASATSGLGARVGQLARSVRGQKVPPPEE